MLTLRTPFRSRLLPLRLPRGGHHAALDRLLRGRGFAGGLRESRADARIGHRRREDVGGGTGGPEGRRQGLLDHGATQDLVVDQGRGAKLAGACLWPWLARSTACSRR